MPHSVFVILHQHLHGEMKSSRNGVCGNLDGASFALLYITLYPDSQENCLSVKRWTIRRHRANTLGSWENHPIR